MKRFSKWAKVNNTKARIIIALVHSIIPAFAILTGIIFYLFDISIVENAAIFLTNLFFVFFILYPQKRKKSGLFKHSYLRQKLHDFILVLSYSFIITFTINNFLYSADYSELSSTNLSELSDENGTQRFDNKLVEESNSSSLSEKFAIFKISHFNLELSTNTVLPACYLFSCITIKGINLFLTINHKIIDLPEKKRQSNTCTQRNNEKLNQKEGRIKSKIRNITENFRYKLKVLKEKIKKQSKGKRNALKILLSLLTIAAMVGLAYIIAILACNIACSGAEGLAYVVAIGGLIGIIWLGVIALKNIAKIGKSNKTETILED